MDFKEHGCYLVKNVISSETANRVKDEMDKDFIHKKHLNHDIFPTAFSLHWSHSGEFLLNILLPIIEKITNLKLYPTYSISRIYFPGSEMPPHLDISACEISATLCINLENDEWPISFKSLKNVDMKFNLEPKSMVVYRGTEVLHWRDKIETPNFKLYQMLLHYVDQNGPFANLGEQYKTDKLKKFRR